MFGSSKSYIPRNLSPEGVLGLHHFGVIPILLGLISSPLCLLLCLLILLQFLLKRDDFSLGGSQLILSIAKEHPLSLSLLFNTTKSCCCTFSFSLLFQQLFLELLIALLGHIKGLHDGITPSLLLLHLPVVVVGNLLCLERGLNSLPKKEKGFRKGKRVKKLKK